jgi:hypothetical protein
MKSSFLLLVSVDYLKALEAHSWTSYSCWIWISYCSFVSFDVLSRNLCSLRSTQLNAASLRYNTVNRPLFILNLNFAWLNSIYNLSLIKKAHSLSHLWMHWVLIPWVHWLFAEGLEGWLDLSKLTSAHWLSFLYCKSVQSVTFWSEMPWILKLEICACWYKSLSKV